MVTMADYRTARRSKEEEEVEEESFPGGTAGYPAHPRLIRPSVILSVRHITFKFSAENRPGPTDLVKYSLKNVNCREL